MENVEINCQYLIEVAVQHVGHQYKLWPWRLRQVKVFLHVDQKGTNRNQVRLVTRMSLGRVSAIYHSLINHLSMSKAQDSPSCVEKWVNQVMNDPSWSQISDRRSQLFYFAHGVVYLPTINNKVTPVSETDGIIIKMQACVIVLR